MYVIKFCAHQEHTKMSLYSTQQFLDKYYAEVTYKANECNLKIKKKKKGNNEIEKKRKERNKTNADEKNLKGITEKQIQHPPFL